jgi:UrcA family protein
MNKLILAASAALLIASPALAEGARNSDDAPSLAVSAKGVDFANREQVQRFYAKLRGAIARVCDSGSASPELARGDAACARQVTAQAVKAMDKPVLTALYNTQGDNNRALAGNDQ